MNEFVEQFLLESRELVEQATSDLLALEQRTDDREKIDDVFRAFHTLKGAAGIVEFEPMGRALHAGESVLAEFRSGGRSISPAIIDGCLACLDRVTQWLDDMEATGAAPVNAKAQPAGNRCGAVRTGSAAVGVVSAVASQDVEWLDRLRDKHRGRLAEARTALRYLPDAEAFFRGEDPLARIERLPGLVGIELAMREPAKSLDAINPFACALKIAALVSASAETVTRLFDDASDQIEIVTLENNVQPALSALAKSVLEAQILLLREPHPAGRRGRILAAGRVALNVLQHAGMDASVVVIEAALNDVHGGDGEGALVAAIEQVQRDKPEGMVAEMPETVRASPPTAVRVLRVDTTRIDALVKLTGELTVVKNALGHLTTLAQDGLDARAIVAKLRDQHGQLDRLVGEMQRAVLRIRVLPMRQVFQRFPRVVREISTTLGKPVKFEIEGDDTEADTAIVESLFEPLLHVLRNAVDHGIEQPDQRTANGKPQVASITLRASRYLDNVIVEVEDDGGGIDVGRVREVAASRNILSADALLAMTDSEVIDLIFAPGFSTAREVTGLSGRGVGMDAVRAAVDRLGGRVSIESKRALGTIVRLTLPFTLMMTRVMTIEACLAGQVFRIAAGFGRRDRDDFPGPDRPDRRGQGFCLAR